MSALVFRAPQDGAGTLVFEGPTQSGTTYTKTLSTTQNSTSSVASKKIPNLILSTSQASQIILAKLRAMSFTATQVSTLQVYTADNYISAVALVGNASVSSVIRGLQIIKSAGNAGVTTLAMVVQSGSGHSSFFKTLTTTQNSVSSILKGIQTIKTLTQNSIGLLGRINTIGGVRIAFIDLATTQRSTSIIQTAGNFIVRFAHGGFLKDISNFPAPKKAQQKKQEPAPELTPPPPPKRAPVIDQTAMLAQRAAMLQQQQIALEQQKRLQDEQDVHDIMNLLN